MHLQQPSICHSSKFIQGTNNQLSFRLIKLSPPKKLITIPKISIPCLTISSLTAIRILPVDRDLDFGPFVMNPFLFFSHCKKRNQIWYKSQNMMCTDPLYNILLICCTTLSTQINTIWNKITYIRLFFF